MDNLQRIAHNLAKRALRNGHDPNYYSPFARSAKRSLGINICGTFRFIIRRHFAHFSRSETTTESLTYRDRCLCPFIICIIDLESEKRREREGKSHREPMMIELIVFFFIPPRWELSQSFLSPRNILLCFLVITIRSGN